MRRNLDFFDYIHINTSVEEFPRKLAAYLDEGYEIISQIPSGSFICYVLRKPRT